MNIDATSYKLPPTNYIPIEGVKSRIVFMNTYNTGMNHYNGWLTRLYGKYRYTTAYTIDRNGMIYQHFNPIYSGKVFDNHLDNTIIGISMVNLGYLKLDNDISSFITWLGDIYIGDKVVDKKWRGHKFWEPYTDDQIESAIELARYLCLVFDIETNTVASNVKLADPHNFNGVMYRSNFEKYYSDLSPAWDFEQVKEKIEI
jgi:N-acetyl-anhydromuramyl-L-alanine amidase AmpD